MYDQMYDIHSERPPWPRLEWLSAPKLEFKILGPRMFIGILVAGSWACSVCR